MVLTFKSDLQYIEGFIICILLHEAEIRPTLFLNSYPLYLMHVS